MSGINHLFSTAKAPRRVGRSGSVTLFASASLALALGANTAVFSVIDGLFLRPAGFSDTRGLVVVECIDRRLSDRPLPVPRSVFPKLTQDSRVLRSASAYRAGPTLLATEGRIREVQVGHVSEAFFETVRVAPQRGRSFTPKPAAGVAPPEAVVSDDLWRGFFGGGDVIGRPITVAGHSYTIVGIAPPGFRFPASSLVWVVDQETTTDGAATLAVVAQLGTGVTASQAATELSSRVAHAEELTAGVRRLGVSVRTLVEVLRPGEASSIVLLFVASCLVLVIGWTQIASLEIVRLIDRRPELAMRSALGASRRDLATLILRDAALMSAISVSGGLMSSRWFLAGILGTLPDGFAAAHQVDVRWTAMLFAGVLAALGLAVSLVVAMMLVAKVDHDVLFRVVRTAGSRAAAMVRSVLLAIAVSISVALVIVAGALVQAYVRVSAIDLGFDAEPVIRVTSVARTGDFDPVSQQSSLADLVARIRQAPGVSAVSTTYALPLEPVVFATEIIGRDGQALSAEWRKVGEGYFTVLGIPLLDGRAFTAVEARDERQVAVVNEALLRQLRLRGAVLGTTIQMHDGPVEIIGVVADARLEAVTKDSVPCVFRPSQNGFGVIARAEGSVPQAVAAIRASLLRQHRDRSFIEVDAIGDEVWRQVAPERGRSQMLGALAALAAMLTLVAIWAASSYGIRRRRREIAIRLALGASRTRALLQICASLLLTLGAGIMFGTLVGGALSRMLAVSLFGVVDLTGVAVSIGVCFFALAAAAAILWNGWREVAAMEVGRELREV